jgi:enoyl-CoA hydratase/carnithine racemase
VSDHATYGDFVSVTIANAVATVRVDRGPMNAISTTVQAGLRDAADSLARSGEARAVVLTGGPKIFAAGADVKEMAEWSYEDVARYSHGLQASFTAIAQLPMPTIAAINGYALGGGLELALCCDLRVAGEGARVGQPEILLGLIPGAGGTQRLTRLVGPSRAKDLIFTGRQVKSAEALTLGIVDRVVADDQVIAEATAWAEQLARGPELALRAAKATINHGIETDLATGLEIERQAFAALFATEDRTLGMTSFLTEGPGKAIFKDAPGSPA